MSENDRNNDYFIGPALERITSVLAELDGYFVFLDKDGHEFVISTRDRFDGDFAKKQEVQLTLPVTRGSSDWPDSLSSEDDELPEIIWDQPAEDTDDSIEDPFAEDESDEAVLSGSRPLTHVLSSTSTEAARRVRFEPVRGDLPPDLQE